MDSPELTKFAQKYGPKDGSHRSGYTPLDYLFPRNLSAPEKEDIIAQEDYQREELNGFTTRELGQLDVISDRELKAGNLQNDIHEIFSRAKWESKPPEPDFSRDHLYPLADRSGMWSSDNPEVWKVLEPCLRLASRFLMSIHLLPWFEALVNGERRPIPQIRCPPGESIDGLFSYHPTPFSAPETVAPLRDDILRGLSTQWKLQWCFMSPYEDPRGPEFDDEWGRPWEPIWGLTCCNDDQMVYQKNASNLSWSIFIFFNYSLLESLMRDDLNLSEKLSLEWFVALTIVHELSHAIERTLSKNLFKHREPYFEQMSMAEVGYDFEVAMFGGMTLPMLMKPGFLPLGYWLEKNYPYFPHGSLAEGVTLLINPRPSDYQIQYPVPVGFYEDIQQQEFWDVGVRAFGQKFLHYRSVREGCRIDLLVEFNHQRQRFRWREIGQNRVSDKLPFEEVSQELRTKLAALESMIQLTPDQKAARNFGQSIFYNSQQEDTFWTATTFQQVNVEEIINRLNRPPQTEEEKNNFYDIVTGSLAGAVAQHDGQITSVMFLEQLNGSFHADRRRNLLKWNRGTRSFVRQLRAAINGDNEYTVRIEKYLLSLEYCRMQLWSPKSSIADVADFEEFQQLQIAHSSPPWSRQICDRLLTDNGISVFAEICAEIMICALDSRVSDLWAERCAALEKHMGTLARLRQMKSILLDWPGIILAWEDLARQTWDATIKLQ